MSAPSDPALLVLHGLRLKGFATAEVVAGLVDVDLALVDGHLERFAGEELVLHRTGRLTGWALTPRGRTEHERRLDAELAAIGAHLPVRDAYERFLALNAQMLAVCTDWQVRGDAVNDHRDAAHDQAVLDRLIGIHDQVRPICADLRAHLARFAGYGPRLRAALERVLEGEHEWFTKPLIDSYHTVWFELHEDLLATLGIDRASEGS